MKVVIFLLMISLLLCGCEKEATLPVETTLSMAETVETYPATKPVSTEATIPSGMLAFYEEGLACMEAGDWDGAIEAFSVVLEQCPQQTDLLVKRGDVYVMQEDLMAALEDYEAALALDDTCTGAYMGVAEVQIRSYEIDAAIETLEAAMERVESEALAQRLDAFRQGNIQDSAGRNIYQTGYDSEGNRVWYHVFRYFGKADFSVTAFDDKDRQIGFAEHLVDENGRVMQSVLFVTREGTLRQQKFQYDTNGNIIREDVYEGDGTYRSYDLYSYNSAGMQIRRESHLADGTLEFVEEITRGSDGQELERHTYDGKGALISHSVYEYNEHGLPVTLIGYDPDGSIRQRIVWEYDENLREVRMTAYDGQGNVEYSIEQGE